MQTHTRQKSYQEKVLLKPSPRHESTLISMLKQSIKENDIKAKKHRRQRSEAQYSQLNELSQPYEIIPEVLEEGLHSTIPDIVPSCDVTFMKETIKLDGYFKGFEHNREIINHQKQTGLQKRFNIQPPILQKYVQTDESFQLGTQTSNTKSTKKKRLVKPKRDSYLDKENREVARSVNKPEAFKIDFNNRMNVFTYRQGLDMEQEDYITHDSFYDSTFEPFSRASDQSTSQKQSTASITKSRGCNKMQKVLVEDSLGARKIVDYTTKPIKSFPLNQMPENDRQPQTARLPTHKSSYIDFSTLVNKQNLEFGLKLNGRPRSEGRLGSYMAKRNTDLNILIQEYDFSLQESSIEFVTSPDFGHTEY